MSTNSTWNDHPILDLHADPGLDCLAEDLRRQEPQTLGFKFQVWDSQFRGEDKGLADLAPRRLFSSNSLEFSSMSSCTNCRGAPRGVGPTASRKSRDPPTLLDTEASVEEGSRSSSVSSCLCSFDDGLLQKSNPHGDVLQTQ